ncbi:Olfactory receptor 51E2 HPRAJ Olfactory receptor [Channa argus]|uniref:Olfactory receptor 51E2 HPRAJ Olfactory receptor n=1 Tax=Channa argus TaxID=215402 RepID=A0A6G1PXF5_CHAAH|nr:Olfactory receptor 51E2 HPRAJ Olfactory receptor [Channa argus]
MENETIFHFNLTMFVNIGFYCYPAFVICFLLFVIIVFANIVIILVISLERTLHEPMYVFIAFLSVNSLYGSTGFFPRLFLDLLSDTHLISRPACFTQIYVIYTYAFHEMTILSIMAYDRYLAVCDPLRYHDKVTPKTVRGLAVFAWIFPDICVSLCIYLAIRLPLCGNRIQKVYCANWNIIKLSCITTLMNNIVGLFVTIITVILPLVYVLYTYFQIMLVCRKSSAEFKSKVFQTCLPHTISFISFSVSIFCDIALSRLNVENLNPVFAVILSLEFVMIPPLLNPLVYGLKLPKIRTNIFRILSCSKTLP